MKRRIDKQLNDGFLSYGKVRTTRNEIKKKEREFLKTGTLAFSFESIRQNDIELYSTPERTLDLKVKTFYLAGIEESHQVAMSDGDYSIIRLDRSNDQRYLYWYLTKVVMQ